MIEFRVSWDGRTLAQLSNFMGYDAYEQDFFEDLGVAFGREGAEFIKPQVRGNGKWQPSTGDTARGIDFEVTRSHNGFVVNFVGNNRASNGGNIANWIDVGNFPASDVIWAFAYGLKAFPISGRVGSVNLYLTYIHGMGNSSPEYPKNFSDAGMKHLANNAGNLAERSLQSLLDRLVL